MPPSIRISQELFNKQGVAHQLAYIQCNFSILPKAITKLESQGLTLSQNLKVLAEVKTAISNAGGHIGQKIQTKLDFVMQNNPGLSKMAEIAKVHNGEEAELEFVRSKNRINEIKDISPLLAEIQNIFIGTTRPIVDRPLRVF
ncbi:hypothetical protein DdX_20432 [Ditylenchus destructor]|uniref:Uncharacterized protein n=1 Tax=Ditylenchus destructor TaxID=166010 RepID=A0AAD4MIP8_9BILA|nr:hypothetical protein DdX_20432 [Ditylenchus destructor]